MKKRITILFLLSVVLVVTTPAFAGSTENPYVRLVIKDVGINVPLYYTNGYDAQEISDRLNSAMYCPAEVYHELSDSIADHAAQGFRKMKLCVPGKSVARLIRADGTEDQYICTGMDFKGRNTKYEILNSAGQNVGQIDKDMLYMYTCTDESGRKVAISYWYPREASYSGINAINSIDDGKDDFNNEDLTDTTEDWTDAPEDWTDTPEDGTDATEDWTDATEDGTDTTQVITTITVVETTVFEFEENPELEPSCVLESDSGAVYEIPDEEELSGFDEPGEWWATE